VRRFPRAAIASVAIAAATMTALATGRPAIAGGATYNARKIVGNLNNVAAFAVAPDGRIFFAERITGKIKVWDPVTQEKSLFVEVPNVIGSRFSELGLVGLALDPDFTTNGLVYAYATRNISGTGHIQILTYEDSGGVGIDQTVIYTSPDKAGGAHVGGQMVFGPDGKLYVIVGERFKPGLAQNLGSERGKILRMNANGSIPGDNPFGGGSRVYSYGHRNGYGLAFDPQTDNLWQTSNGPECNDEINRIVPGGNYAWGPTANCATQPRPPKDTNRDGPDRRLPKFFYRTTRGLTGMLFCDSCDLNPGAEGQLFWGDFNTGRVTRAKLTDSRGGIESVTAVHNDDRRVLSMEAGPDGRIYYSNGSTIYRLVLPTP
jgi:glucose/arabinose dehydrogenase